MALSQEIKNTLWKTADKLRNNMDASEYKHIVLGLIFLKYISDKFLLREKKIKEEGGEIEDIDEYKSENVFWIPYESRWETILNKTKNPRIGEIVDKAMIQIEKENPDLNGVLPKNYSRPELNKTLLGELIEMINDIDTNNGGDFLGEIYEYFLGEFALSEGKKGGEFFTPTCIVDLLVEIIKPNNGRVYDPCCGSGGMFVHSEKFVLKNSGKIGDIVIYGQESNPTTLKLCKMNLSIRGFSFDLSDYADSSFTNDLHPNLKADFILANPPFNISDYGMDKLKEDRRWAYGIPPEGNANYAWIQHFIYHLSPKGKAGFVLANGSMSSNTSNEGVIRKELIEKDLVEGIVAMPDKLFSNTGIPACLWFINRDKKQKGKTLFLDLRDENDFGEMINRRQRKLTEEDIKKISKTFENFQNGENYQDIKGYCKSASLDEIKKNDYILTPGRYVGIKEEEEDKEPFEDKMKRLTNELKENFEKGDELKEEIKKNMKAFGFEI
jgi:type I restriction enzyme M protein